MSEQGHPTNDSVDWGRWSSWVCGVINCFYNQPSRTAIHAVTVLAPNYFNWHTREMWGDNNTDHEEEEEHLKSFSKGIPSELNNLTWYQSMRQSVQMEDINQWKKNHAQWKMLFYDPSSVKQDHSWFFRA